MIYWGKSFPRMTLDCNEPMTKRERYIDKRAQSRDTDAWRGWVLRGLSIFSARYKAYILKLFKRYPHRRLILKNDDKVKATRIRVSGEIVRRVLFPMARGHEATTLESRLKSLITIPAHCRMERDLCFLCLSWSNYTVECGKWNGETGVVWECVAIPRPYEQEWGKSVWKGGSETEMDGTDDSDRDRGIVDFPRRPDGHLTENP